MRPADRRSAAGSTARRSARMRRRASSGRGSRIAARRLRSVRRRALDQHRGAVGHPRQPGRAFAGLDQLARHRRDKAGPGQRLRQRRPRADGAVAASASSRNRRDGQQLGRACDAVDDRLPARQHQRQRAQVLRRRRRARISRPTTGRPQQQRVPAVAHRRQAHAAPARPTTSAATRPTSRIGQFAAQQVGDRQHDAGSAAAAGGPVPSNISTICGATGHHQDAADQARDRRDEGGIDQRGGDACARSVPRVSRCSARSRRPRPVRASASPARIAEIT